MAMWRIAIRGIVQGVGFRPFVKRLADRHDLTGVVYNTGDGLVIELHCDADRAEQFVAAIRGEKPPLAVIAECTLREIDDTRREPPADFRIEASRPAPGAFTLISPDISTCADCLAEIRDRADRRFGYEFTNCTNCGPRYTITRKIPYDRSNTTMAPFAMCPDCAAEYGDPQNRRFHAEPTACPACGPRLSERIDGAIAALARGEIVALKGLGGFQLACDAHSEAACNRLRERKRKNRKPFALMMKDAETVERYCIVSEGERELLRCRAAPIVLLELKGCGVFPEAVAPGLNQIGAMLPNTPLHHGLFAGALDALVMTSGNFTEEPIVTDNAEARGKLSSLADRFLLHDRDIFMRVDDSVSRWFAGAPRVIRRARGYAPEAIDLGFDLGDALGVGAELKNTFCLTKNRYAIVSQHIGDFENLETQRFFEEALNNLSSVHGAKPEILGHDLHPDYLSTRWARAQPQPKIGVQHHHAHIASCMAENGVGRPVIGIAWDGTGYGTDGQIWGGEFLICDFRTFRRAAHFRYIPLIGSDRASRECWRAAAAHLFDAFGDDYPPAVAPLRHAATAAWWSTFDRLLQRPQIRTSSAGRLFDAIAALTGVCLESGYEGEAAMLLEAEASKSEAGEPYPFAIDESAAVRVVDTRAIVRNIAAQCVSGHKKGVIAATFHLTLGHIMKTLAVKLRGETGLNTVCLSGGTFQNGILLAHGIQLLRAEGFEILLHSRIPANDGGISLGQAVIAATTLQAHR